MSMNVKSLLLPALLLLTSCGDRPPTPPAPDAGVTNYDGRGIIQQISPDLRTATIKHQAIAGYMPAMTMDFKVKDTNELAGLGANDEVTFQLAVTETNDWIHNIHFVAHHIGELTNSVFIFHAP